MSHSKLLSVTVERFKCFEASTTIDLAPLTVILGRNNSGKSSLIQSLLLLKQTLAEPRPDVPLHLEGTVSAFNLRELTYGWPQGGDTEGPTISVRWSTVVDVQQALSGAKNPDRSNWAKHANFPQFTTGLLDQPSAEFTTSLTIYTRDQNGTTHLPKIELGWINFSQEHELLFTLEQTDERWDCWYRGKRAVQLTVELDHFIPYLRINRSRVGPRDRQRAWHNTYLLLLAQPIEALKQLLGELQYLGSTRAVPPSLYKSANVAPREIGVSGELAAQLLHRRQHDLIHYLPPLLVTDETASVPAHIKEASLVDAVNDVLSCLSIRAPLTVEDIQEVGFRLLFGQASLLHVGRGLTYLLPFVELGLFADPLRFQRVGADISLTDYDHQCSKYAHLAVEESEAHLHPKVQSRLAHWLVSLAMSRRRMIIETHSDHLVRRLRGLIARAGSGSELERWLLRNVVILEVEQDAQGRATVTSTRLTAAGGIGDHWPADFMDEASEEDSAIYYAALDKSAHQEPSSGAVKLVDGEEPVPELEP